MADEIRAQYFGPGFSRAVVVAMLVELGPSIKPDLLDLAPDEMGQSGLSVKPGREPTATAEVRDLAVVLLVALPSCAEAVEIAGEFIAAEVPAGPGLIGFLAVSSGFGDQVRVDPVWWVDEGVRVSLAV